MPTHQLLDSGLPAAEAAFVVFGVEDESFEVTEAVVDDCADLAFEVDAKLALPAAVASHVLSVAVRCGTYGHRVPSHGQHPVRGLVDVEAKHLVPPALRRN